MSHVRRGGLRRGGLRRLGPAPCGSDVVAPVGLGTPSGCTASTSVGAGTCATYAGGAMSLVHRWRLCRLGPVAMASSATTFGAVASSLGTPLGCTTCTSLNGGPGRPLQEGRCPLYIEDAYIDA